jgi:hypothetical protein
MKLNYFFNFIIYKLAFSIFASNMSDFELKFADL